MSLRFSLVNPEQGSGFKGLFPMCYYYQVLFDENALCLEIQLTHLKSTYFLH